MKTQIELCCPVTKQPLQLQGQEWVAGEYRYPIVDGVPILLPIGIKHTHPDAIETLAQAKTQQSRLVQANDAAMCPAVDPYVDRALVDSSGSLYAHLLGNLPRLPIPHLRLPNGEGKILLEIGCNWGRWSVAAAQKGWNVVAIDPSLEAIMAARRIAKRLGVDVQFIVADARFLPFANDFTDQVFSYSVLQHFSLEDADASIQEVRRVLKPGGQSLIQMANCFGVRSFYHQLRRGFGPGKDFNVRYRTPKQLRDFASIIGTTTSSADGFFGLGIQSSDMDLMTPRNRMIINTSEFLRKLSVKLPLLASFADSLYLHSSKPKTS